MCLEAPLSSERGRAAQGVAIILLACFAVAVVFAWLGVYEGAADQIPTIQYGILVPIAVGAALIWRSETVSRIIDAVPQPWLIGVQVLRGLGTIFGALCGRTTFLVPWFIVLHIA